MHNYHDTYSVLPVFQQGGLYSSINVAILPFLEQSAVFDLYNQKEDPLSTSNEIMKDKMPTTYMCPSAEDTGVPISGSTDARYIGWQTSDYTFPTGSTYPTNKNLLFPGFPNSRSYLPFSHITDGLSNTLMSFESGGRTRPRALGKSYDPAIFAGYQWGRFEFWTCNGYIGEVRSIAVVDRGDGTGYNVVDYRNGAYVNVAADIGQVYSFHAGGANIALADGAVRFISESIHKDLFEAIASRDAGEVVGEF